MLDSLAFVGVVEILGMPPTRDGSRQQADRLISQRATFERKQVILEEIEDGIVSKLWIVLEILARLFKEDGPFLGLGKVHESLMPVPVGPAQDHMKFKGAPVGPGYFDADIGDLPKEFDDFLGIVVDGASLETKPSEMAGDLKGVEEIKGSDSQVLDVQDSQVGKFGKNEWEYGGFLLSSVGKVVPSNPKMDDRRKDGWTGRW